ncbi:MAG: L-glutamate gamma-semialdehyde dehydrogenase [Gemmataceae bacterium]
MKTHDDHHLETLTQAYGREIFARMGSARPIVFTPTWFDERLMNWTMGDEAIKVQLFRFVDVLPMLKTPNDIATHLREYFGEAAAHLPGWLHFVSQRLPSRGLAGRLLSISALLSTKRLARRFIAGSNVKEVLATLDKLRRRQLAFTVDLLGEATIAESEAIRYQEEYLGMIDGLCQAVNDWPAVPLIDRDERGPLPRVNVSVKFSSLYSQFDPIDPVATSTAVRDRLRPILRRARRQHAFINVDMEQYSFKDLTLRIFREVLEEEEFRDWADIGIAIQVYLRDTDRDLEELRRWVEKRGTPIWIRLVKGAYWDYETVMAGQQRWPVPVYTEKAQSDAAFERLTRFLFENHEWLRPALGSHNVRNLAHAIALAQHLGLPPGRYEIQMLYGMADTMKDAMVSLGQRVRVYTPFGKLLPGMAYLVRRLLENTSNESFLRAAGAHVPEEKLLMNPLTKVRHAESEIGEDKRHGHATKPPGTPAAFHNEPLIDFSRAEARAAMERALEQVKGELGRTYPLVIDNQPISTEGTIDSVNPSRFSQVVGRCSKSTTAHAERALQAARAAFPAWRDLPERQRANYFFQAAEVMRRRRYELAAWQVYECGKQWREADADVAESIDYCDYYASEMLRLAEPRRRNVPGEDNEYFYEPRGVVVVIAPWNFPLAILTGMTAAALVTGNTAIMKPAEQSSVIAAKLMEIFQEVGLPAGVASYLPGIGEEIGPTLTQSKDVALIAFTGSKGVGLLLNRQAAETPTGQDHVKRAIAEMGGKNAIIVDNDADLDEAVHGVALSAFGYAGQKCSACSRVVVLDAVYDQFLARLLEVTRSLKVAPADDPGSTIGPVIDAEAQKRILETIEKGKPEAELAYAGDVSELAREGYFVGPHIFAGVKPDAVLAQEEIFGPVLAVIRVADLDEALRVANGTSYALTGGLYSRSPQHIARVKREFRVGNLYINRKITGAFVDRQPFGGFKLSGIGSKAGGPDYLLQFLQPRVVTENTMRRGFAPQ